MPRSWSILNLPLAYELQAGEAQFCVLVAFVLLVEMLGQLLSTLHTP